MTSRSRTLPPHSFESKSLAIVRRFALPAKKPVANSADGIERIDINIDVDDCAAFLGPQRITTLSTLQE
jgi:hypothetical protein